ncbi:MAG: hypothetical protein AB7L09_01620 [Nitrospira sp.]
MSDDYTELALTLQCEFYEVCRRLLERDGLYQSLGEDGFVMRLMIGDLHLELYNNDLIVTLPSPFGVGPRIRIFDDEFPLYEFDLIEAWLPRLRARLVLEDLANAAS